MSAPRPLRFWLVTAAALAAIVITFSLGQWQLGRGRERDALQAQIDERQRQAALSQVSLLSAQAGELMHRPVVLRGTWDASHTVFLDNRQMHGMPGFYVVTPMKLDGAAKSVLVQRGWVPRNFDRRDQLPVVKTPGGVVEVQGRIAPPPSRLYDFKGTESGPIRQNLDIPGFAAETRLDLLGVSVQQTTPAASEGLLRDWPSPGSGSERNYGYAFQWWALCAAIAILYAWFQFIAPRRKAPHAR
ncbi:MAG TPA: SURF1 family protein [Ramlibacter sp.]|nr:SURF1 family protein [Ramlibacter sp.]